MIHKSDLFLYINKSSSLNVFLPCNGRHHSVQLRGSGRIVIRFSHLPEATTILGKSRTNKVTLVRRCLKKYARYGTAYHRLQECVSRSRVARGQNFQQSTSVCARACVRACRIDSAHFTARDETN